MSLFAFALQPLSQRARRPRLALRSQPRQMIPRTRQSRIRPKDLEHNRELALGISPPPSRRTPTSGFAGTSPPESGGGSSTSSSSIPPFNRWNVQRRASDDTDDYVEKLNRVCERFSILAAGVLSLRHRESAGFQTSSVAYSDRKIVPVIVIAESEIRYYSVRT